MNNFKQIVITTNNILCYALFTIVALLGLLAIIGGALWQGIVFTLLGWLFCAMVCGYWLLMSNISDHTARQVVLAEKQEALIVKQNKVMERMLKQLEATAYNEGM